jgi:hypothetical protein
MGGLVLGQLSGPPRSIAWSVIVVTAALAVMRGSWPDRIRKVPAMVALSAQLDPKPARALAELELEISGAMDDRLAADRPLRSRLRRLAEDLGGEGWDEVQGRQLLGSDGWDELTVRRGPLAPEVVDGLLTRIEGL